MSSPKSQKICSHHTTWVMGRGQPCKWGENCRYAHPLPVQQRPRAERAEPTQSAAREQKGTSRCHKLLRFGKCETAGCPFVHIPRSRKVCEKWTHGECTRGSACWFTHPRQSNEKVDEIDALEAARGESTSSPSSIDEVADDPQLESSDDEEGIPSKSPSASPTESPIQQLKAVMAGSSKAE